jgi:ketosteroid isomerase-like protein
VDDPVEIFKQAVEALNRVDLAEIAQLIDPEIAFVPMRSAVSGAYMGHAGIEDFIAENDDKYEYFRAEFDTIELLPDGRLLSIGRIRVRGRAGEAETVVKTAGIASFRAGRMLSWHDYGDEALARAIATEG